MTSTPSGSSVEVVPRHHGRAYVIAAGVFTYLAIAIYSAIGFIPYEKLFFQVVALAVCTGAAWILRREACARASLVAFLICLICVWPTLQHTWPLPLVAVCAAMVFWWRPAWILPHEIHGRDVWLAIFFIALSAGVLVGGIAYLKPNVGGLAIMFPPWRWYALIPVMILSPMAIFQQYQRRARGGSASRQDR